MPRKMRKAAILAKLEATPYQDAAPAGAENAILIANLDVTPYNAQNVDRGLIRPFLGRSGQLVGPGYIEISFEVELAGSGTAGVAPPWGPLVQACAFAELVTEDERVEYVPLSDDSPGLTIYYHRHGVKRAGLGCKGSVEVSMLVGERPTLRFRFLGKAAVPAVAADPTVALSVWKVPKVVSEANTDPLIVGGAYAAGAVTGGTTFTSAGLSLNLNADVQFIPLVGAEYVEVVDRQPSGQITLDLSAAQEVTFDGYVRSNALQSIALAHGKTAGNKVLVFAPAGQLSNQRHVERNGLLMNQFDVGFDPVAGNDELRIVVA